MAGRFDPSVYKSAQFFERLSWFLRIVGVRSKCGAKQTAVQIPGAVEGEDDSNNP
jgi:hypothetical protein